MPCDDVDGEEEERVLKFFKGVWNVRSQSGEASLSGLLSLSMEGETTHVESSTKEIFRAAPYCSILACILSNWMRRHHLNDTQVAPSNGSPPSPAGVGTRS